MLAVSFMMFLNEKTAADETVYTYLGPGDTNGYTRSLLVLALDKSETKYGKYSLRFAPTMNEKRALKIMKEQNYINPIRGFETRGWTLEATSILPVKFPVYLGIYGYRVCFLSSELIGSFAKADSLDTLRKFSYGLKTGWHDVEVLRHNALIVRESTSLAGLYRQVGLKRIEVFCRAAVELPQEQGIIDSVDNIKLDQTKAFFYPLPFFFYTRESDVEGAERLEYGLKKAYDDGSLMEVWNRYHRQALTIAQLNQRQVIVLTNPVTEKITFPYQHFTYQPLASQK